MEVNKVCSIIQKKQSLPQMTTVLPRVIDRRGVIYEMDYVSKLK